MLVGVKDYDTILDYHHPLGFSCHHYLEDKVAYALQWLVFFDHIEEHKTHKGMKPTTTK